MDFYQRYEELCRLRGIEPCSQKAADALGTSRSLISNWKKGVKPNPCFIRAAADMLNTTTDYLLGRTDDPEDFSNLPKEKPIYPKEVTSLLDKLDGADLDKVVIFMQGILAGDKYQREKSSMKSSAKAI